MIKKMLPWIIDHPMILIGMFIGCFLAEFWIAVVLVSMNEWLYVVPFVLLGGLLFAIGTERKS